MEFNNLKIDFTEEQSMVNASAKEFCADNERDKISNYTKTKINTFDKKTKKFNKT